MADEYSVDLDRLDEVAKKLSGVLKDMQTTKGKAAHSTYLPKGALGTDFEEETELHEKHRQMKEFIDKQILQKLEDLIDDLRDKTVKTHGFYSDNEQNTVNAVNKSSQGSLA